MVFFVFSTPHNVIISVDKGGYFLVSITPIFQQTKVVFFRVLLSITSENVIISADKVCFFGIFYIAISTISNSKQFKNF